MDITIEFRCGHTGVNPTRNKHHRWICPVCGKPQAVAQYKGPCQTPGCNNPAIGARCQVKFCPQCRKDRAKRQRIESAKTLSKRVRELTQKMMNSPDPAMTFEEIAAEHGTTPQNTQQIAARGMVKFRSAWIKRHPDLRNPII